jgi:hypothetical protein
VRPRTGIAALATLVSAAGMLAAATATAGASTDRGRLPGR